MILRIIGKGIENRTSDTALHQVSMVHLLLELNRRKARMGLLALSGSIRLLSGAFDLKVPQLPLSFQGSLQKSCDIHIPRNILRLEKALQFSLQVLLLVP